MKNDEKDINKTVVQASENEATSNEVTRSNEDQSQTEAISALEDDIIRNDTIPETSKDTPGSNGAFPVGAFDTSKD